MSEIDPDGMLRHDGVATLMRLIRRDVEAVHRSAKREAFLWFLSGMFVGALVTMVAFDAGWLR